jgi:hypothetical protein
MTKARLACPTGHRVYHRPARCGRHDFLRLAAAIAVAGLSGLFLVQRAAASRQIDRNGTDVQIRIDAKGEALVSYLKNGEHHAVLISGAENALPPDKSGQQVRFKLDYNRYQTQGVKGSCGAYDGPHLPYLVAACKAPDGSYWAVQEWPKELPDLGFQPWTVAQRARAMDVSHWTGAVPKLVAYSDWVYSGRYHSLFGQFTYDGKPVYGFSTTRYGKPTDSWGRLAYLDTRGGPYGSGWVRENSFVSHNPTGVFCYGFYKFDPTKGGYTYPPGQTSLRGPDVGSQYRLAAVGPGVTPDVETQVDDPGDFDANSSADVAYRLREWRLLDTFIGSDKLCRQGRALGAVNLNPVKNWFSSTPNGAPTTSFQLGKAVYFNVQFDKPLPSDGGRLDGATVKWLNHNPLNGEVGEYVDDTVQVSADGLVASEEFGGEANVNNKRFTGPWVATMTVDGLAMGTGSVTATLDPGTYFNTGPPTVSGTVAVGNTLTFADNGSWNFTPTNISYQWIRCPAQGGSCVNVSNSRSYTVSSADVGWVLGAFVNVTDPNGVSHEAFARLPSTPVPSP